MSDVAHEFIRSREITALLDRETSLHIESTAEERNALAERLGLLALTSLSGEVTIHPWRKNGLRVRGQITADVEQACSVTLEPVPESIKEEIDIRYLPEKDLKKLQQQDVSEIIEMEEHDPPEVLPEGSLDLGALIVEFFVLALNPYPRKAGAQFATEELEKGGQTKLPEDASNGRDIEGKEGPFSALGKWKNRVK